LPRSSASSQPPINRASGPNFSARRSTCSLVSTAILSAASGAMGQIPNQDADPGEAAEPLTSRRAEKQARRRRAQAYS
jgi:hypothetical protein